MAAVGLITEYNPFHNGHKFHLQKALELTKSDTSVVIMNGNFVQRGMPAIADKYTRTEMALAEGADFVFELPVQFGLSSAEDFARGSVLMLHELGFVDSLCFGSESGNINQLDQFAELFANEPTKYKKDLNFLLKEGFSYPAAREKAALKALDFTGVSPLSTSNNLLGIEYLKALKQFHCTIQPFTITRTGTGYHDLNTKEGIASASAIRMMNTSKERKAVMPENAAQIYENYRTTHNLIDIRHFSDMIYYALMQNRDRLEYFKDISLDLANRIRNALPYYTDAVSFLERLDTKQYTRVRLNRCLFQVLIGLEKQSDIYDSIPLRLLGMRKEKSHLLNRIPNRQLLVTKPSKAKETLSREAYTILETDFFATDLYSFVSSAGQTLRADSEYKHSPIIY